MARRLPFTFMAIDSSRSARFRWMSTGVDSSVPCLCLGCLCHFWLLRPLADPIASSRRRVKSEESRKERPCRRKFPCRGGPPPPHSTPTYILIPWYNSSPRPTAHHYYRLSSDLLLQSSPWGMDSSSSERRLPCCVFFVVTLFLIFGVVNCSLLGCVMCIHAPSSFEDWYRAHCHLFWSIVTLYFSCIWSWRCSPRVFVQLTSQCLAPKMYGPTLHGSCGCAIVKAPSSSSSIS